jgi:hypothetical protein
MMAEMEVSCSFFDHPRIRASPISICNYAPTVQCLQRRCSRQLSLQRITIAPYAPRLSHAQPVFGRMASTVPSACLLAAHESTCRFSCSPAASAATQLGSSSDQHQDQHPQASKQHQRATTERRDAARRRIHACQCRTLWRTLMLSEAPIQPT